MFKRISGLSNVCLRCQRRIAIQSSRWADVEIRSVNRIALRHQSTAAAEVDRDDDQDVEAYGNRNLNDQETQNNNESESDIVQHKSRRRGHFRRWRPHETADLGMSVLGKPAEVLLIESRDRKIDIVPQEESQEKVEGFYEALASEKEPLSWDQVKSHIEHTREQTGQLRGQLEVLQWTSLQSSLKQGFKLSQLMKYLIETRKTIPNAPHFHAKGVPAKHKVIEFIATEIWGYSLPERPKATTTTGKSAAITQVQRSISFQTHPDAFHILRYQYGRDALRKIALLHSVETVFSLEHLAIVVKGDPKTVATARGDIEKLKQSVKTITFPLKGTKNALSALPSDMAEALLEEISARHGILLRKMGDGVVKLTYCKSQPDIIELIQRDLQLSLGQPQPLKYYSMLNSFETKETRLVPTYLSSQLPWFESKQSWYRLYDVQKRRARSGPMGFKTESEKSDQRACSEKVFKSLVSDNPKSLPQGGRPEYSAHFGQSLFAGKSILTIQKKKEKLHRLPYSMFANEIPMLPQLLGSLTPWESEPKFSSEDILTRLRYMPESAKAPIPYIEILLFGNESSAGSKQKFRIAHVNLIHAKSEHTVLLPDHTIDVRFVRQLREELFTLHEPGKIHNPKLLQFLADHINQAEARVGAAFAPYLRVPESYVLEAKEPKSAIDTKTNTDPAAAKASNNIKNISFILTSADVISSDAYKTPTTTGFALELTGYEGRSWGVDRQDFRLVEQPLLHAPSEQKLKFQGFFNTAISLAERLRDLARKGEGQQEGQR